MIQQLDFAILDWMQAHLRGDLVGLGSFTSIILSISSGIFNWIGV